MRFAAFLLAFILAVPLSGADPGEPLDNTDLLQVTETFEALQAFRDNEFIHEEKLGDALDAAREHKGRAVKVVVDVVNVTKSRVRASYSRNPEKPPVDRGARSGPSSERESPDVLPVLIILESLGPEEKFSEALKAGAVGESGRSPRVLDLDVGALVPLELAKTLRSGDRLEIHGKLAEVFPTTTAVGRDRSRITAGFVIVEPEVRKVEERGE